MRNDVAERVQSRADERGLSARAQEDSRGGAARDVHRDDHI